MQLFTGVNGREEPRCQVTTVHAEKPQMKPRSIPFVGLVWQTGSGVTSAHMTFRRMFVMLFTRK